MPAGLVALLISILLSKTALIESMNSLRNWLDLPSFCWTKFYSIYNGIRMVRKRHVFVTFLSDCPKTLQSQARICSQLTVNVDNSNSPNDLFSCKITIVSCINTQMFRSEIIFCCYLWKFHLSKYEKELITVHIFLKVVAYLESTLKLRHDSDIIQYH